MNLQPIHNAADFRVEDYDSRERIARELQRNWERPKRRKSILFWCLYAVVTLASCGFLAWALR